MIPIEQLKGLAHLDLSNVNGRNIPLHSLHDEEGWHLWIPGNDSLVHINGKSTPVECCYYATEAVGTNDIRFPFLDFFEQRAYWPDIAPFVDGIYADLLNGGASLTKLQLIFDHHLEDACDPSRMVVTEIEYVFLTCRSIFDLLQEALAKLWEKVHFVDQKIKKKNLPTTYRKMVLRDDVPMTQEDIEKQYHLPKNIAEIYIKSADFFVWLRSYRDLVAHSGHTPNLVFTTEHGFAISKEEQPFRDMKIWTDSNSLPNNLGSVLAVVSHLLTTTFSTCDAFASALQSIIQFPPPIAPKHRIFICGPHVRN
jgi:hypothetical protein